MSWSDRYIGTPYAPLGRDASGCDCWGLACVIYRAELGLMLPDYLGYGSVEEHAEIAAVIGGAAASPLWAPVLEAARSFDIAVFRRGRLATHVGIVVRPGLMIHMDGEDCAKVAGFGRGAFAHRLTGIYRHRSMAVSTGVKGPAEGARP